MTPNAGFAITAPFAFECQCCKYVMPENKFYQIIKETVGGCDIRRTNKSDIRTTEGIFTIKELGFEPKFSSTLNYVKGLGGYICDQCNVSVCLDDEHNNPVVCLDG